MYPVIPLNVSEMYNAVICISSMREGFIAVAGRVFSRSWR